MKWALAGLLGAGVVAVAAAHLPGHAGIVARVPLMFAVVTGWLLGWLAGQFGLEKSRRLAVAAGVLVAAAFVGMTAETYRLRVRELRELFRDDPGLFLTQQMLSKADDADAPQAARAAEKFASQMRRDRQQVLAARSRFPAFLKYRVSSWGSWGHPWPAVFWGFEILLAGLVAAWLFGRIAPSRTA